MAHTQGPWEIRNEYNIMRGNRLVAATGGHSESHNVVNTHEENSANAHLICAAPDLLSELEDADFSICEVCKIANPQHKECEHCLAHDTRMALIAKAKGK